MNIEVGKGVTLQRKPTNENNDVIYEAKSGRKYHNIPNELDVDTWDNMTVAERLCYKGLITGPNRTQYNPYEEKC